MKKGNCLTADGISQVLKDFEGVQGVKKLFFDKYTAEEQKTIIEMAKVKLGEDLVSRWQKTLDAMMVYDAQKAAEEEKAKAARKKSFQNKIKGTDISYSIAIARSPYDKEKVQKNKKTLYIFTDNLQAHNAAVEERNSRGIKGGKIVSSKNLIDIPEGPTINVHQSTAQIRTDLNGEPFSNTRGLVTKLNAEEGKNKWIGEKGYFTEEDKEAFIEANKSVIKEIKELLALKDSEGKPKYTSIVFPEMLGDKKAGLTKDLATELSNMLREELGLITRVEKRNKLKGEEKDSPDYYTIQILKLTEEKAPKEDKKTEPKQAQKSPNKIEQGTVKEVEYTQSKNKLLTRRMAENISSTDLTLVISTNFTLDTIKQRRDIAKSQGKYLDSAISKDKNTEEFELNVNNARKAARGLAAKWRKLGFKTDNVSAHL